MSAWWAIVPCLIFLAVGLVVGAEFGGKPRPGVHVIRGEMDPDYDPPSTSLNPAAHRVSVDTPITDKEQVDG